jgi:TorA maturation chaperone TorD
MPDTEVDRASAGEDLCRFLAACYYEPTEAFVEEGLFASMAVAAERCNPDLASLAGELGSAFAEEDLQALLVDYTRLFLGPVEPLAQPYASFWLSGEKTVMQDSTMAVLALYAEGGFEIDESFSDLPDHVAVQLEFLYLIEFKLRQARAAGAEGATELQRLQALRRHFLDEHLASWLGRFAHAVQAGAACRFYRQVGLLTEAFIGLQRNRPPA